MRHWTRWVGLTLTLRKLAMRVCRRSPPGKRLLAPRDFLLSLWASNPRAGDPGHHSLAPDAQTFELNLASVLPLNCALLWHVSSFPCPPSASPLLAPPRNRAPGWGTLFTRPASPGSPLFRSGWLAHSYVGVRAEIGKIFSQSWHGITKVPMPSSWLFFT